MRMHAQLRPHDRLHISRPPESSRVNHPLHPRGPRLHHIDPHPSNLPPSRARNRRGQSISIAHISSETIFTEPRVTRLVFPALTSKQYSGPMVWTRRSQTGVKAWWWEEELRIP